MAGTSFISSLFTWKFILIFFTVILAFSTILTDVFTGVVKYSQDGDYDPLVEATAGKLLASDHIIEESVEELKNPDITTSYSSFLKQRIFTSLVLLALFFILLNKLMLCILRSTGVSTNVVYPVAILFTLVTLIVAETLYKAFLAPPVTIPFSGIISLIQNRAVFLNTGISIFKVI